MWILVVTAGVLLVLATFGARRQLDRRTDDRAWRELIAAPAVVHGTYEPALVSGLPEAARRYFDYMIEPGTPLVTVVELRMVGDLGLGTKPSPRYRPMRAHQILAPPHGLVWRVVSGLLSGSDGALPNASWTRFRLAGLLPVVRAGGADHQRSAFGRVVAEAAFWVPASLLPSEYVRWESTDDNRARAIMAYGQREQAVEITVARDGAPAQVLIQRWSNENADKVFRVQPFGGELYDFERFGGYRLPTRVEGGNHFGTDDYFPFFRADVTDIRFPGSTDAT